MKLTHKSAHISREQLEFKRKNLPDKPGCYLFKDENGEILYIGKAKSIKKRVNSYWRVQSSSASGDRFYSLKIQRLIEKAVDFDIFIVENEMEALLLENELIKTHKPDFNVMLKDDKSFPWVQITNEAFPRIRVIRNPQRWGLKHTYIGPFVDSVDLKRLLQLIRKIFPYCTCKKSVLPKKNARPCVNYQLKLCSGPCAMHISENDYKDNITNIEKMLTGDVEFVESILQKKMTEASNELEFEVAAAYRDRIEALQMFTIEQSVFTYDLTNHPLARKPLQTISNSTSSSSSSTSTIQGTTTQGSPEMLNCDSQNTVRLKDVDVIAGQFSKKRAGMIIIHVKQGRLLSKTPYIVEHENKITSETTFLEEFVKQHYLRENIPIPDEVILKIPLSPTVESSIIHQSAKKGKSIIFRQPLESDKTAGLLRIAEKNIQLLIKQKDDYEEYLRTHKHKGTNLTIIEQGLEELRQILNLKDLPMIIEGFDMAHTQGTDYTGSMVCFVEGVPSKPHYRRYKVKSVDKPDDVAAMQEVMSRRYRRAIAEETLPDLVVVDGGKAQLNMAHKLFQKLNIEHVPHIGLVKPKGRSEVYTPPKIITPNSKTIIQLSKDSPGLHIIQHLRNESHRFANQYHKKLRQKRQSKSELDDIPGIGPARKRKLIQYFGSVKEIKRVTEDEIGKVVGKTLAHTIYEYFLSKDKEKASKKSTSKFTTSKSSGGKRKIILKKTKK
ncbi:MAG: excinuclease ABC subunit UvrC [Promethearchaeota archaeon]